MKAGAVLSSRISVWPCSWAQSSTTFGSGQLMSRLNLFLAVVCVIFVTECQWRYVLHQWESLCLSVWHAVINREINRWNLYVTPAMQPDNGSQSHIYYYQTLSPKAVEDSDLIWWILPQAVIGWSHRATVLVCGARAVFVCLFFNSVLMW